MPEDDFEQAVEQLYAGPADQFIAARTTAVQHARAAGDKELADRLGRLRRPTAAAALINALRRGASRDRLTELVQLGARLREAQRTLDVPSMKTASAQRNSLIGELVDSIEQESGPLSASVREQVIDTFTAAVADESAGRAVASGRLVSGLRYSGFGEVDLENAVAIPLEQGPAAPADHDDNATNRADAARRLQEAKAALSAAEAAETAALAAGRLADQALAAAQRTAAKTRQRVDDAAAAKAAAQQAVTAAEKEISPP